MLSAHTGEEVLTEARTAALGLGRHDLVAEADILLSQLGLVRTGWAAAERRTRRLLGALAGGDTASRFPDRSSVTALGTHAVSQVLTGRHAEAIATARQLVTLAERLGLPADKGHGLHVAGEARILAGDLGGLAEVEQGLALMDAHGDWRRLFARQGHTQALWWYGDLERCAVALAAGRQVAEDQDAAVASWFDGIEAALDYAAGRRWDAVEATADRLVAEQVKGRIVTLSLVLRSRVRLRRGQVDQACADAQAAFQAADANDTRYRQVALALQGCCLLASGRREQAVACLEDVLADQRKRPAESCATTDEADLLLDLGYPTETLPDGLPPTRWHQAVQALVARDFDQAVKLLTAIGSEADIARIKARLAAG